MRNHALAIAIAFSILGGAAGAQKERTVNVYNWSDYIDPRYSKTSPRRPASR